jgi:hypothetical protein
MHTDYTLRIFEVLTVTLGDQLQNFANVTCTNYNTFELPREAAARQHRNLKNPQAAALDTNVAGGMARCVKTFTMDMYKHHALGDYVETIQMYGTCDSYSTETVYESTLLNKFSF